MAPPAPLRGVLFDATGTLIELAAPVGETYARAAESQGVSLPAWRIEDGFRRILAGAPPMVAPPGEDRIAYERAWWRGVVRDTFRATDQTASFRDFEAMFEELWRHFADAASWRLRPGCRACLGALRDGGLVLGVLSNFDHRLPAILDGLGIAPLFGAVVLPGDAGAAKPDPRCFAAGLAALGLEAGQTAYVGDDPEQDVAGARAAGLRVVDVAELPSLTALPDRLANLETASGPLRSL